MLRFILLLYLFILGNSFSTENYKDEMLNIYLIDLRQKYFLNNFRLKTPNNKYTDIFETEVFKPEDHYCDKPGQKCYLFRFKRNKNCEPPYYAKIFYWMENDSWKFYCQRIVSTAKDGELIRIGQTSNDHYELYKRAKKNYKLTYEMIDFKLPTSFQDAFKKRKRVDSVFTHEIENNENVEISRTITNKRSVAEKVQIKLTEDSKWMWELSITTGASFGFDIKALKVELSVSTTAKLEHSWSWINETLNSIETVTEFEFSEHITVKPYTSVAIDGFIDIIDNLKLPFDAKVVVRGLETEMDKRRLLTSDGIMSLKQIALLLPGLKSAQVVAVTDSSITVGISGTITATFGVKTHTKVRKLKPTYKEGEFCFTSSNASQCLSDCQNHFDSRQLN